MLLRGKGRCTAHLRKAAESQGARSVRKEQALESRGVVEHADATTTSTRGNTLTSVEPGSDEIASPQKAGATDSISDAERELYGGRLRYDQSYVRHEGPLTRLKFGHMAAALPQMVGMVLRTGWKADRRALMGVVAAELGQGVTAGWGLVAVNGVLAQLFADGPTVDKLHDALPSLVALAVAAVATAVLSAWSTAMSGRLEPQVERAVSARYYRAVTGVEVEATERPEIQRILEAGRFGTDSARSMLRLSVGVGNVVIGMAAAAVVLAALHWTLLPMLLAIALPKGWGAVRSARRDYLSRMAWVDHRRAIASLLAYLTRPHAAGEIRVHAAGTKLLSSYEEMSRQTEAEQRRLARAQASTDLVAGAFAGVASLACYGVLWWLLSTGGLPLAVGGTAVIAIRTSTARLTSLVQQVNRLYEELLFLTDTEDAIAVAGENAIPHTGTPLPAPAREVRTEAVSFTYPGAEGPSLKGVSVRVPRGKVTALVGANGSGKTTLTKVLAGLLLPSEGDVWWVGESGERVGLREADRAQVFAEVGLLAQDFPRWEMTAAANVAIGAGDRPRDMDRVRKAAGEASVLKLVEGLPHGWDSIVFKGYERGVQLSRGQWQKLGSARTRYRQAPFLLVDEPTSALDPHAEIAAFEGLWSLAEEGHAVVLVTHRLAATMHADHIYVLDQGCAVEDGTHEDLMSHEGGLYQGMFTAQAAQYGIAPVADVVPGPRSTQPSGQETPS
ncbi:ABC transporter ATP-binding protein [Streptomyces venezuelae ATCC 10712]|uniref:ABC transporter ATP-binding protein n=1 Tax=Streptomyces venezuelae (strain ATCC 10712 / CBS 650.69 / DSM 40230 / JCM 4526 / NBRC 13096 / PD 04745) TaxID=953739 RepID=F2R9D5_STRVP|nr:ABC transporter [Streptomyces venezuelae]CCA58978.1 ABC transporter ATP-binding protein [Streptomyces venezuelae ATCC 10712]